MFLTPAQANSLYMGSFFPEAKINPPTKDKLEFWIHNTKQALKIWESVPQKRVNLDTYHSSDEDCGSLHCVGGWLIRDKYFQDLGFHPEDGVPVFDSGPHYFSGSDTARILFGSPEVFSPRGGMLDPEGFENMLDYDAAKSRLRRHLSNLEASLKEISEN